MYYQLARMLQAFRDHDRQDGQTLVEYSLILALVAIGAMVGLTAFAVSMDDLYHTVMQASDAMSGH